MIFHIRNGGLFILRAGCPEKPGELHFVVGLINTRVTRSLRREKTKKKKKTKGREKKLQMPNLFTHLYMYLNFLI